MEGIGLFGQPDAGRAYAVKTGRELAAAPPPAGDRDEINKWIGRACAILRELTRDA